MLGMFYRLLSLIDQCDYWCIGLWCIACQHVVNQKRSYVGATQHLLPDASEPGVVIKGMWAVKLCSSYILWFLN